MWKDANTPDASAPVRLEIPESRRGLSPRLMGAMVVLAAVAAGCLGWKAGVLKWLESGPALTLATLEVDQGEMVAVITENGTVESSNNAAVKCQVEALVGLTGGSSGILAVSTPKNSAGGITISKPNPTSRSSAKVRAGAAASHTYVASGVGAGGATMTVATVATTGATSSTLTKPTIRSFSYSVPPYTALRPRISIAVAQRMGWVDPSMMIGGRGGGVWAEKPGSTRIIKIVDEGTKVKAGDLLCELDSSKFRDELKAQQIRYLQAKSWVEQAQTNYDVNMITLREYQEGVYPQDVQLVRQYITSCKVEEERARNNYAWSKATAAQGFRSPSQAQADALTLQQAEFRLRDADYMANRLEKFTAPRVVTNLKAKIEAIKSDLLAQEAAFQLETDRLKRLETAIANCTIRAPRDGVVVYFKPPNMWGRVEAQIREGVTVREGQTLIEIPDPKHMRVRARINESKVAAVHVGQKVRIDIDAFPDHPLMGTVSEVTPIPSGANGPISDVKIYYAMISIDLGGMDGLRPGLSAEVSFLVNAHHNVVRVPLVAIRWVESRPYAAVARRPAGPDAAAPGAAWEWRPVTLGQTDAEYAEVISGLNPGERVVSKPELLPTPRHPRHAGPNPTVAHVSESAEG
jgi:HlyD family secretion protein